MKRLYDSLIQHYLLAEEEMIFLSGPRQVGKTTLSKSLANVSDYFYFNWDNEDDRAALLAGPQAVVERTTVNTLSNKQKVIGLDEIHKRPDWKNFVKGFYDTYKNQLKLILTGSACLETYIKGGDSLMGRYFPYRMHPLSVAELINPTMRNTEVIAPEEIEAQAFENLLQFGGFPKPYLKQAASFSVRWQRLRKQQLLQEDIRDLSAVYDISRLSLLTELLELRASKAFTYSNLAKQLRVSVDSIMRWISLLEATYYCYCIKPWSKNITRSIMKEPKVYLWDWSVIKDPAARAENFIASHLLKAVHYWTDSGLGNYDLYYLRDKEKREVDFVVTRDGEVWFLVEVKLNEEKKIASALSYFQALTSAQHAFQVVLNKKFINKNCFDITSPVIVPAKTFLSQLV